MAFAVEGIAQGGDSPGGESLEAKSLSCRSVSHCQKVFEEHWAEKGVKMQRVESSVATDVEALLVANKQEVAASAQLNLKKETEGIIFKDGAAASFGWEGTDKSTMSVPPAQYDKSGNTVILHFHPNRNPYQTQLLPSQADLIYSLKSNAIMVNMNPRNTSDYLIYRGVPSD
ncbi:hypothetical protein [Microbulbifer thermotolerans]|uniref:hypothetical protein n=1 Tax=Microbulbifer thermotolerans TaxID=252514 RepID=UPI00224980E6|nr:hypothetical protein [Microbulbifer thermotolerans]MCX2832982.1 hypothetical protein [Microbulbifer thermotolerans]